MITPDARAVLDAARRIVEVLPLEGLEWPDLIAAVNLPGDIVRRAVPLLECCEVVWWDEDDAVYSVPGADGATALEAACRVLEVLPSEGVRVEDLAARAGLRYAEMEPLIEGLYAAGLIRWARGPRVHPVADEAAP